MVYHVKTTFFKYAFILISKYVTHIFLLNLNRRTVHKNNFFHKINYT